LLFYQKALEKSVEKHVKTHPSITHTSKLTKYNSADSPKLIAAPNSDTGSQPKNKNKPNADRLMRDAHNSLNFQSSATLNSA
jgi:hypothetical protein|tara:strand:+ start:234 stop:479 length:246 start_codon:yes stop_codon:yes gene_type:complete